MDNYNILSENNLYVRNIFFGEVVENEDIYETRVIKVRIEGIDKGISNDDLPECFPLLPPFFHFIPKVGERVAIILDRHFNTEISNNVSKRYYLSNSLSEPANINYEPKYYTGDSHENSGAVMRGTPIRNIPDAKGVYPTKDVVGIIGRDNTDLLMKDKELLLRVGRHIDGNYSKLNSENQAYLQLKYNLENSINEITYKTIVKEEIIPAEYNIYVSNIDLNVTIKIFKFSTNETIESINLKYEDYDSLVLGVKNKIFELQKSYKKWSLSHNIENLKNLPTKFLNDKRIIKEQIEVESTKGDTFKGSVANLVADKINILSSISGKNYNLNSPEEQISPEEQMNINSTAHPLVHGDKLVELLSLFKTYVSTHVHPYHGVPNSKDDTVLKIVNYNLQDLLNENIKIK